ncbi:pectinesterase family protein, partial [Paenibacillus agri]
SNKVFISMIPAKTFTTPLNAAFVRISMKNEDVPFTQLEVGITSSSFETFGNKIPADSITGLTDPTINAKVRIIVAPSGGQYASISTALASITDASEDKRYEIYVKKGTYTDTFRTKPYVDIIGEDKYKTIISFTGVYSEWVNLSTIFAESECTIKNLTVETTDAKYPIHADKATGKWTLTIENVRMIHHGSLTNPTAAGTPIGIGLYPYQHIVLKYCEMISNGVFGASGVFFHNQDSTAAGNGYRSLRVEQCKISGVTYGFRPNSLSKVHDQDNDAYIVNNVVKATHQEFYYDYANGDTDSWHIFDIGNKYTQG